MSHLYHCSGKCAVALRPSRAGGRLLIMSHKSHATFIHKIDVAQLPIRQYEGDWQLVRTADQVEEAVELLQGEEVLGFDTETRPSFRKGQQFPPSLLQLAGAETVVLVQISQTGIPLPLRRLLENPAVVKVGAAIHFDVKQLEQYFGPLEPAGFVDLASLATQLGIRNTGLRSLAALRFGMRLSKRAQCSNWGRKALDEQQQRYAATDAWISRRLYQDLQALITAGSLPEPEPEERCHAGT